MKPRLCLFLAAISVALAVLPAGTARRPRYGGILRLEIGAEVTSLDPAVSEKNLEASSAKDELDSLVYGNAAGTSAGDLNTGPFRAVEWQPGRHAVLAANDDYPRGRPFVDSIDIRMGRPAKDRLLDLEANKTDLADISVEDARRAAERGVRVSTSQPDELLALVFVPGRPLAENARAREAVARAIDRASIANFVLQKKGEPAGGLLPQWSSGTAFLFSTLADPSGAKEQWARIGGSPKILLGYDSGDALEQMVAERLVVNAREAGIVLALSSEASAPVKIDARLVRMRMTSSSPRSALASFLSELGPLAGVDATALPNPASSQQIYEREQSIVGTYRVVPIVWLPQVYGLSERVRDWKPPVPGKSWPLADVWLDGLGEARGSK
jgi:hypothetical protein